MNATPAKAWQCSECHVLHATILDAEACCKHCGQCEWWNTGTLQEKIACVECQNSGKPKFEKYIHNGIGI